MTPMMGCWRCNTPRRSVHQRATTRVSQDQIQTERIKRCNSQAKKDY
ncbi:BQ5605_C001g00825 [Microbotryum silenes-dioicae]|uniref:BQ5605_C001g00825 protein n=1 Tax=Microbotryum silenes-dioicae TaxID=796604 RepID=A0A2X0P6Y8_9BASI|nr:BQ5605_C001g00825 [Microbotryum silenes-dioicae]